MLASDRVLPAMADSFAAATGALPDRLLVAIAAGQEAGGDLRGRLSAALLVVAGEPATDEDDGWRADRRVDDSGDPVAQLRMLRNLQRAYDERDYEYLALFAPEGARDLYAALASSRRGDRDEARRALEAMWPTGLVALARLDGRCRTPGCGFPAHELKCGFVAGDRGRAPRSAPATATEVASLPHDRRRSPVNPSITSRPSPVRPAGEDKGAWLAVLEQGSRLLQETTPLKGFHVYVVGFHPAKDDPGMQMEAHHFCRVVNDDLLQCVLFDGNTREANLIGVEYIVSEKLFDSLPEEERAYWHPHNFEVLSGQLVAPGLPEVAERAFMRRLINSYGKTWHTWHTGRHDGEPGMDLPLGDPELMWSFNREGECDEAIKEHRNTHMGIDAEEKRARRQELVPLAHPQRGVDLLADAFPGSTPVPGVVDAASTGPGGDG